MVRMFKSPIMSFSLIGAGIVLLATFGTQRAANADVSVQADCCQEIAQECTDRFGWKYADSRPGPTCGPIEIKL